MYGRYILRGEITLNGEIQLNMKENPTEDDYAIKTIDSFADELRRRFFKTRRNNPETILIYDFDMEETSEYNDHSIIFWSYKQGLKKNLAKLSSDSGFIVATDIILIVEKFGIDVKFDDDYVPPNKMQLCNREELSELVEDWVVLPDPEEIAQLNQKKIAKDDDINITDKFADYEESKRLAELAIKTKNDQTPSTMARKSSTKSMKTTGNTTIAQKKAQDQHIRQLEETELFELPFMYSNIHV